MPHIPLIVGLGLALAFAQKPARRFSERASAPPLTFASYFK
jgi:hypothetical protein